MPNTLKNKGNFRAVARYSKLPTFFRVFKKNSSDLFSVFEVEDYEERNKFAYISTLVAHVTCSLVPEGTAIDSRGSAHFVSIVFRSENVLGDPEVTANICCKSRNLPNIDTQNYSTDFR